MMDISSPFSLNATLIAELATFAVVVAVIAKIVLPPLRKAMTTRQAEIDQGLADAATGHRLLARAETQYQQRLDEARCEAADILATYRQMAADIESDARTQATVSAAAIVRAARRDAELLRRNPTRLQNIR
jgi:F-type H+-transporting ATPase subunit b